MASNTLPSLVELRHLTFGYGERVILDDVSLSIPRGKVTALMGASGGGKTTILRLIGGQNRAQSGQLLFDGQDVTPMDQAQLYAARRRMGMLFQFGALFADLSVFDNVAFPLREHTALSEVLIRDIVLMKLNAVGLRGATLGLAPLAFLPKAPTLQEHRRKSVIVLMNRAGALEEIDKAAAVNDYTKVIELNPENALAYAARGVARPRLGRRRPAMRAFPGELPPSLRSRTPGGGSRAATGGAG